MHVPPDSKTALRVESPRVESPCVRACCLDNHDICVGCNRSLEEILQWSESSQDRKLEIIAKCRVRSLKKQNF